MSRILALDIGEKRVGVAVSDASRRLAFPVCVLPTAEVTSMARTFRRILEDNEPSLLVCGLPISLDGEENQQASRVHEMGMNISATCGIPVEFMDERLSSSEAKRILREMGLDERAQRGKVDSIAASLFLQAYIDRNDGRGAPNKTGDDIV